MLLDDIYARVAQQPDAIAVQDGDRRLSYRELLSSASGLAAQLTSHGAGPERVVAVHADRSAELVVGELAALLAQAAYLPLDPAHPVARTRELLALSGATTVVTTAALAPDLALSGADVLTVDLSRPPSGEPTPLPRPAGATLAYVIFTSGSTGRPKGVAVTHASLGNLLRWHRESHPLRPGDRTTLLVSPGFDVSVWDTWPTLAAGATLVVAPAGVRSAPHELVAWLADARITLSFLPTPLAEMVLDEAWPAAAVLRTMTTGGAALNRAMPAGLPFTLINAYGPAECTVISTAGPVLPGGPLPPSIGRPIDGVRCYVLDGLDPVPDGEPGELCLAGDCVARGYLGDPAGTARSFVPDIGAAGGRMYRTGDRVRRRPDGVFEYIGRIDDQVKIRGFRIEPGEVAAVLRQHPSVRESFVAATQPASGDLRLIGYVAADATPAELIEFAAARLPGYMVPAAVVVLPSLPLTPNGKVDRAALPAPRRPEAGLAETAAARNTPTEDLLAAMVTALTGAAEVGNDDDFYALGGTSLLVGRLAAQIRADLGVTVSMAELLGQRTVGGIGALVDGRAAAGRAAAGRAAAGRAAHSAPGAVLTPAPGLDPPPLRRAARDRPIPLSLPQERVWFFEQLSPGNLAYNFQATVSLRGELDTGALRAALDEIVRRHEILRTAFVACDGDAQQRPQPRARAPLRILDVPAEHAEKVIAAELRRPFDLARPPLARWLLLRHGGGENTLVHVEHHFVHDGWSFAVLLSELSVLYPAFAAGQPSPLPELSVQYADYAVWQRDWMRGEVLQAHVRHWTERLAGAPAVLELPADRPRPPAMTFRGAAPRIAIPAGLSRALRTFGRRNRVSLFTVMYAGFAALLHRYTGEQDLLVGSGAANRGRPELEPLLGMLVNTLVLRTRVSAGQPFSDLVSQVQETVVQALEWSDTPVDAVIEAIGPARDPSRTPLFQVMFSFHDSAVPDIDFGGLTGAVTERTNSSAKSDLNVIVIPRAQQRAGRASRPEDDDLTLVWEYSTDLFDASTMSQMIAHYLNLLSDAVARPATEIGRLNLVSAQEAAQLRSWSRGPSVAAPRLITDLVAEQVRRAPEAIAIIDSSVTLTYGELGQRADEFAAALAALGVGPESVVAVYAGRSAHLVVGELAALMAGAAFLPLDPGYPARRVSELLASSGAVVLLTTGELAAGLAPFSGVTLRLDQSVPRDQRVPAVRMDPGRLAYLIYTSGSTGRPKGVLATHGGLANMIGWLKEAYRLAPGDRSTMVASPAFDASVWEIWSALAVGGTLVVPPEDVRTVPRDLVTWLAAQRITWAFLPTPLAEAMLDEDWPAGAALRFLLTGGDAISRTTPDGLPFTLVNHYGPTETTVMATATAVPPGGPARPPIGRPLGGARAYVLAGLDPVPVGVPGELYIGGAGVTRGYLGDPAATAAVFVPDPWEPGQRMYRTGDRARWLPDGRLGFIGRTDDQVKIRGFRIEPGEIAATLRRHPAVSDAVVVTRPDAAGRPRLTGYAVTTAAAAELRDFLAERLPSYLVPDQLIPLSALPRTPNGKVDRAALPVPQTGADAASAPAATDTERRISALWQDLLGVPAVGAGDDFFALGGYSLLVGKMLAQVEEAFGCRVPLSVFLSAPTIASLAGVLDQGDSAPPLSAEKQPAEEQLGGSVGGIDIGTLSDAEAATLLALLAGDADDA